MDRRFRKSEENIKRVFLDLLKKKNINKISVSEVCNLADLGRGTFYLHYTDIYDLYQSIENELYKGLLDIFDNCFPTINAENSQKLTNELITYIEKNKDLFLLLIHSGNTNSFNKLKDLFNQKVLFENKKVYTITNDLDYIESIFVVSGMVGVLEKWLIDGMLIDKKDIAEILNKILLKINVR